MNLFSVTAGVFLTTGIASYAIIEYQSTLQSVKEIQYEHVEDVEEEMNIRDAIDVVRRNNAKRKKLIHHLNRTLEEGFSAQKNE